MNKSYRSVWNHALGAWVAVSEITAARGKRSGGVARVLVGASLSGLAAAAAAQTYDYADVPGAPVGQGDGDIVVTAPTPATLNSLGSGTATQAGDISGTGAVVKTGLGTIILSGNNSYAGGTTISGGALQVDTDGRLGQAGAPLALDGGTLRIGADAFASGRGVALGSGGGTIDVNGTATSVLSGVITGGGSLSAVNSAQAR